MTTARTTPPSPTAPAMAPWIDRQLQALLAHRGHALLLAGPSGLGQCDLALALARAWLCDQPTPHGACGHCVSCHAVDVRAHADLLVLVPDQMALDQGWPLDEKTRDKIEKKEIKPSKWIRVDAARGVVEFAQTTRSRGRTKVVLVYPADRLNHDAANTLLKTLEEPAGDLRFVLATDAAHSLPATIRSRCQTHPLQWPDEAEALAWLATSAPQADDGSRRVWLKAAGMRPDDALVWAECGLTATQWAQLPRALMQGDAGALSAWSAPQQLATLQKLCHDLMAVSVGAQPRFFEPGHLPSGANAPALADLQAWSRELLQAARTVEHPFSVGLTTQAWVAQAAHHLRPQRPVGERRHSASPLDRTPTRVQKLVEAPTLQP